MRASRRNLGLQWSRDPREQPSRHRGRSQGVGGTEQSIWIPEKPRTAALREGALAAARVWRQPPVPPSAANLGVNPQPNFQFDENDDVDCRFSLEPVGGMTLKFNCELPDGTLLKIKYGETNAGALYRGGCDPTRIGARLRRRSHVSSSAVCGAAGCPPFPFPALRCLAKTGLRSVCFPGGIDHSQVVAFHPAVVEQRFEGRKIEAVEDQGWAWYELDKIDPARGGSPRAEVDALRLLAVFLAHWDNKAENQRLVCLPSGDGPDQQCTQAFAIMQDLGGSFGPNKLDLHNWRNNSGLGGSANVPRQHGTPAVRREHVSGAADLGRRPAVPAAVDGTTICRADRGALHRVACDDVRRRDRLKGGMLQPGRKSFSTRCVRSATQGPCPHGRCQRAEGGEGGPGNHDRHRLCLPVRVMAWKIELGTTRSPSA